jgi:ParB family transcriptional regulator, chromosome partitioning protein
MPDLVITGQEIQRDVVPGNKRHVRWPLAQIASDPLQPRSEFDEQSLTELAANLQARGQLCPVIGYPAPADPTRLILVDGERRLRAARRVPLEFLDAIVLPERPSPSELLLAQLSVNQFREQLTPREQCAAYGKLLQELKITQVELAKQLGVSPSKVCKVLARDRIRSDLQAHCDQLEASVVPLIAKLPPDQQGEVMTFAMTPTDQGRLPTRDQVEAFIEAKLRSRPSPRHKTLAVQVEDRLVRIAIRPDDTHDSVIDSLKAFIILIQKNRNVSLANLDLLVSR